MTLERVTGLLKKANVNPDGHGERMGETREEHMKRILYTFDVSCIVEQDKRKNWPAIEAEIHNAMPCQEFGREEIDPDTWRA